jgi:threonine synthase
MGLPIRDLVIATNQNDILHRTLETGAYTKAGVTPSISPSMDIQVSSNFERVLFDAYGRDGAVVAEQMADLADGGFTISQGAIDYLRGVFKSGRVSEEETMATIKSTYDATGEVLCPHSAVGVKVAQAHLSDVPMITLATAHPAKFPAAVKESCGRDAALPPRMSDLFEREERVTKVPNELSALETLIRSKRRP